MYSSLNHLSKLSGGKYTHVTHEDAKALVAQYAREQLEAVTILIPRESVCPCSGRFFLSLSGGQWSPLSIADN